LAIKHALEKEVSPIDHKVFMSPKGVEGRALAGGHAECLTAGMIFDLTLAESLRCLKLINLTAYAAQLTLPHFQLRSSA
jgi:hypothetical protein